MGLYDRDYYRQSPRGGLGAVRVWSITTWLIVVNVAVFLLDALLGRLAHPQAPFIIHYPLTDWGAFSIDKVVHGQGWRLLTYAFLHAGPLHIIMNMIGLWLFGPVVELNLGVRRYMLFYALCAIAGPLMYAVLWGLGILMPPQGPVEEFFFPTSQVPMVGASAAVFGVLLAAAHLSPDRPIYIYFMDIKLKYLAWIMVGLAAYAVQAGGGNAGGDAAHLGGALAGFLLIRAERLLDVVQPKRVVRGHRVKDWSRDFNR